MTNFVGPYALDYLEEINKEIVEGLNYLGDTDHLYFRVNKASILLDKLLDLLQSVQVNDNGEVLEYSDRNVIVLYATIVYLDLLQSSLDSLSYCIWENNINWQSVGIKISLGPSLKDRLEEVLNLIQKIRVPFESEDYTVVC